MVRLASDEPGRTAQTGGQNAGSSRFSFRVEFPQPAPGMEEAVDPEQIPGVNVVNGDRS